MSIENQRRVTFIDDISPITSDILNDLQGVVFDTFSNLNFEVVDSGTRLVLSVVEDGYTYTDNVSAVVVNGRIRFPDGSTGAMSSGLLATSLLPNTSHDVSIDAGDDSGVYTNLNLSELKLTTDAASGDNSQNRRWVVKTHVDNGKFHDTEMVAGALARSNQRNKFTFESIDGNSTPLSIVGINEDKTNLFVESDVTFKPHDDPDMAADGYQVINTAQGGIETSLIWGSDRNDGLDPTVVIGQNLHIPGDITVDGDLIFDTHELGTLGASRWDDLLSANETLPWELADCTFEHLLPNPSHAPLNHYPIGSVLEIAVSHDFDSDKISTWPTGWLLLDDQLIFDLDHDITRAWLTPLIQHLEGPLAGPLSGDWSFTPGYTRVPGAFTEPFIFLGPMSYLHYDATTGDIEINPNMQQHAYDFENIKFVRQP